MTMAITIWQPWASLIMAGAKPYEFRRWPAPRGLHGSRIAIHAGARPARRTEIQDLLYRLRTEGNFGTSLDVAIATPLLERWMTAPTQLPLSSVLGTALLGTPIRCTEMTEAQGVDSDRVDHHMWAWPLTAIEPLEPFAPARGAQGFWPWP